MSNIDETKGAGSTSTTNRTDRAETAGETAESEGAGASESAEARGKIPEKTSSLEQFRDSVYGPDSEGAPRPQDGDGEVSPAFVLRAERRADQQRMTERKQMLGEALDAQQEEMGVDWEADGGVLFDKWASAWQDEYSDRSFGNEDAQLSRAKLENALYQNGQAMSDDDIEEVVADHRERLAGKGAFEGWGKDDVEEWQNGVTAFLEQQRDVQPVREFDPPPIEGLPAPSRNLEARSFDDPEAIRRTVEQWEANQLDQLERLADEGELEKDATIAEEVLGDVGLGGNEAYSAKRDRIQEAAETYVRITVGDEDGTKYAYPETVETSMDELRPRDAYIRHLEENPGDIMGAYEAAEERMRQANRHELHENLASAAG